MKFTPPDRRRSLDHRTIRVQLGRIHIGFGMACLVFPGAFKLPIYTAFAASPASWGVLCVTLGFAILFIKSARLQIVLNTISAFVFLVIAGAISARTLNTGTLVYLTLAISSFEGVYLASRDMFVVRREIRGGQHGR